MTRVTHEALLEFAEKHAKPNGRLRYPWRKLACRHFNVTATMIDIRRTELMRQGRWPWEVVK